MNSKFCILVVIALCLTLVHAGGKYCPEPQRKGPCPMSFKINDCCNQSDCPCQSTCCKLPCGNICKRESPVETSGVPVKDGEPCVLGIEYLP
uniref:U21-Sparatoxin-Hju1i_2 n=1 Tax=Heteropoda jugulans TaxID=1358901 RepID=A0A4Q8KCY7_9ARAC